MPQAKNKTLRQTIMVHLEEEALTVRDLSQIVGISEKDVVHHLGYIEKTLKSQKRNPVNNPFLLPAMRFFFQESKKIYQTLQMP